MPSSSLTPTQLEVLGALVKGSSVTAAARAAGLHRTTIHHWSRVLPDFRALLQDARNSRAEAVADSLYDLSDKAIDAVRNVLEDQEAPVTQRLKAALAVINSAVSRPRALPTGNITAEEFDLIVDDIFEMESPTGDGLDQTEETAEPAASPCIAAEPSPEIHHISSQFITKEEIPSSRSETPPAPPQTPRSAPCPCGSGQKFKRCCGRGAPPVLYAAA
jgi:hypothetical protein